MRPGCSERGDIEVNNEVARFMMQQIDERVAKRKRPLDIVLAWRLDRIREVVAAGYVLTGEQEQTLTRNYERFSDPDRLKWGSHVRIR